MPRQGIPEPSTGGRRLRRNLLGWRRFRYHRGWAGVDRWRLLWNSRLGLGAARLHRGRRCRLGHRLRGRGLELGWRRLRGRGTVRRRQGRRRRSRRLLGRPLTCTTWRCLVCRRRCLVEALSGGRLAGDGRRGRGRGRRQGAGVDSQGRCLPLGRRIGRRRRGSTSCQVRGRVRLRWGRWNGGRRLLLLHPRWFGSHRRRLLLSVREMRWTLRGYVGRRLRNSEMRLGAWKSPGGLCLRKPGWQ